MSTLPDYRTILYASDLGKHTRPVFRHAVSLARQTGARIVMLHVVEPLGTTGRAVLGAYLPDLDVGKIEHEGMRDLIGRMKERLYKFCRDESDACDQGSALVSEVTVGSGLPSEVIMETAKAHHADLIVMGSCTHGLFGHRGIGSTARKVTQHSDIPVLLVPNLG